MMKKLLLALAVAATLSACGSKESTSSPEPAASTSPSEQTSSSAPAGSGSDALDQAASGTQESAGAVAATGDSGLERMAAVPENAQLPGGRWKAGTHYQPIVPAQATSAEPGQVEVLEVFWFGCPHCAHLEPFIEAWKKKLPSYVKFQQEHVMWGPAYRAQARLFYTLEALNRDDLVGKVFDEIHGPRRNNLVAASESETQKLQIAFAKANGISEADFMREYNSFSVNSRLQRAEELTRRYRVETVPTLIVNGKYRTDVGMAGGENELIQLLGDLAAFEKSR